MSYTITGILVVSVFLISIFLVNFIIGFLGGVKEELQEGIKRITE